MNIKTTNMVRIIDTYKRIVTLIYITIAKITTLAACAAVVINA